MANKAVLRIRQLMLSTAIAKLIGAAAVYMFTLFFLLPYFDGWTYAGIAFCLFLVLYKVQRIINKKFTKKLNEFDRDNDFFRNQ